MFAFTLEVLVKTNFFDLVGPYEFSFTSVSCAASALRNLCITHFVQVSIAALIKHSELQTSNNNIDSVRVWPHWPYASVNKGLLISITEDQGLNHKCLPLFRSLLEPRLSEVELMRGYSHMSRTERLVVCEAICPRFDRAWPREVSMSTGTFVLSGQPPSPELSSPSTPWTPVPMSPPSSLHAEDGESSSSSSERLMRTF